MAMLILFGQISLRDYNQINMKANNSGKQDW